MWTLDQFLKAKGPNFLLIYNLENFVREELKFNSVKASVFRLRAGFVLLDHILINKYTQNSLTTAKILSNVK